LSALALDRVADRLRAGERLDAREVRITAERLQELLARLGSRGEPARVHGARFDAAQFVEGDAHFERTQFSGDAHFERTQFSGDAHFDWAQFSADAHFDSARFPREADFRNAQFAGEADFRAVTFGRLRFKEAVFSGQARFDGARFSGDEELPGDADFSRAQLPRTSRLGPLATKGRLVLDRAVFAQHVTIEVRAEWLRAVYARFPAGTDILAQSARIDLDRAELGGTSTVSPITRHENPHRALSDDYRSQRIPSIVSLQWAQIADLGVSGVDLRGCCFEGAQGVANLRLEQVLLAEPPKGWKRARRLPLPIRWTRRVAIADEHWWRVAERYRWDRPVWAGARPGRQSTATPHQIAAIYRSLREGREMHKDEPGAADFYYGEMEMRRLSTYAEDEPLRAKPPYRAPSLAAWTGYDNTRRIPLAEKSVLWVYWLVSGYGLRASRALVALAITIAVGAGLLSLFGFDSGQEPESGALLFAVESSLTLLRAPDTRPLTDAGEAVAIALRLLGPLFFALALLSLRGRIRR
jgi:uncharacterized protein YjbI with pentapeptide repeats